MQFNHLSPLQKIFAPQQPQPSQSFDLLTSWVFCVCILFIIFLLFRINPSKPFLPAIAKIINCLGYTVFSLMIFDIIRNTYFDKMVRETSHGLYKLDKLNRVLPIILLAGVIFWLGRTIKKAATLQKENDLTI